MEFLDDHIQKIKTLESHIDESVMAIARNGMSNKERELLSRVQRFVFQEMLDIGFSELYGDQFGYLDEIIVDCLSLEHFCDGTSFDAISLEQLRDNRESLSAFLSTIYRSELTA